MHRGGRGDARASCASPLGTPLFMGLPDPDQLERGTDPDAGPPVIKQKIVRKIMIPTVLLFLCDFLSLNVTFYL
jgi:hypothetical protein